MKEIVFLNKNASRWKELETALQSEHTVAPDRLAELFVGLTDDLSYARTFYPGTSTESYLNNLVAKAHLRIYRNKKQSSNRFLEFWARELPLLFLETRSKLLYSFGFLLFFMLVGLFSSYQNPEFVRLVMGDAYVDMTLENIESGDPMAVYKQANEVDMFLGITVHNLKVSLMAFAYGLLLSVGTVYVLFMNGIMLGSFHALMAQQGVLGHALTVIWLHGTFEIWAIAVAASAGLCMGNSLLFPGTYTRRDAFQRGAGQGIRLLVGLVPFFVVAGFIEGFVTRHSDMPLVLRLLVIFLSAGFILWYFFLYPNRLAKAADVSLQNQEP